MKTVQLFIKKPLLIYSTLLIIRNTIIYSLKRTKLNKNSAVEIVIIKIKKL